LGRAPKPIFAALSELPLRLRAAKQTNVTAPVTPHSSLHRERWRGVARTFGASMLARVVASVLSLLQVPLALAHLGSQAYGLWMTLTGIWALLSFADLGLGLALQNQMAAAGGRGDQAGMKGLMLAGTSLLARLSAGLAVILFPLVWWLDWARLLHIADAALAREVRAGMVLVVLGFCINLPLSLAARLASAAQKPWLPPLWGCAASAGTLAGVAAAVALHAGFIAFLALSVAVPLLQNAGLGLHVWRELAWRRQSARRPSVPETRALVHEGLKFFVPQAGAIFAQSALPAAIAIVSRPEMVTQFNLLQRMFGLVSHLHGMVLAALWPAYAEAQARGDEEWIRRSFWFSLKATAGFAVLLAGIALLSGPLVRLWLGGNAPTLAESFVVAVAVWTGGLMLGQPFALLLGGLGHPTGMAIYGTASHVLALAGMFWWGPRAGAVGVVGASAVAYLALNLPCTILDATRRFKDATRPAGTAARAP
jgi:O-antigen/teichoic acid export membrane protein